MDDNKTSSSASSRLSDIFSAIKGKEESFREIYDEEKIESHRQELIKNYKQRWTLARLFFVEQLEEMEYNIKYIPPITPRNFEKYKKENEKLNTLRQSLKTVDNRYKRLMEEAGELARKMRRVEDKAMTDSISGLPNKKACEQMYEFALKHLELGEEVVVVTFDLDKFKDVNDTIGHEPADQLLRKIGQVLRQSIRSDDFASRVGGDEFVIILNRVKKNTNVLQMIQRLAVNVSMVTWRTREGLETSIGFSAGYAIVECGERTYFSDARERADHCAILSKRLGRNRLTIIQNGHYQSYALRKIDQAVIYVLDKQGATKEIEILSEATCFEEVKSNSQRAVEEIERFFGNSLNDFLRKQFFQHHPQDIDIYDLNYHQMAQVLFHVRTKGK